MPSASPFDDLLNELDAPLEGPNGPDPRRADLMERLIKASKKLESVALILDPSGETHPLHGLSVPDEARGALKMLVEALMRIQSRLQTIEQALLDVKDAETIPERNAPGQTPLPRTERRGLRDEPRSDEAPWRRPPDEPADTVASDTRDRLNALPSMEDGPVQGHETRDPAPIRPAPADRAVPAPTVVVMDPSPEIIVPPDMTEAAPSPSPAKRAAPPPPPALKPTVDLAALTAEIEKERNEFDAYRAQWEAAFAAKTAERADHPEVQAYYEQMEAYFKEKDAFIAAHRNGP